MGPTAANSCPGRLVFVKSPAAKERLKPCLDEGNVRKSMSAPVVAIVGIDLEFYEKLGKLFPHNAGARSWYRITSYNVCYTKLLRLTPLCV